MSVFKKKMFLPNFLSTKVINAAFSGLISHFAIDESLSDIYIDTPCEKDPKLHVTINLNCPTNDSEIAKLVEELRAFAPGAICANAVGDIPKAVQVRGNKKKRIRKKWANKYGYYILMKEFRFESFDFEDSDAATNFRNMANSLPD